MPLKKILLKAGVNRENTRYTSEGGWYECNNVRFRQGTPEKIGGWTRLNTVKFLGVARSLWNWITLGGQNLIGVGTNIKFYIENGGTFNDITPLRSTTSAGEVTFSASVTTLSAAITSTTATTIPITDATGFPLVGLILIDSEVISYTGITDNTLTGCSRGAAKLVNDVATNTTAATHSNSAGVTCFTILVSDANNGATAGDFVTFTDAAPMGGNFTAAVLNLEYEILTLEGSNKYTIVARSFSNTTIAFSNVASTSADTGNGGSSTVGAYQLNVGVATASEVSAWGAGGWGAGLFGQGVTSQEVLRIWSQQNFGEDLIFGPRGGRIYYWAATDDLRTRAVELSGSNVPVIQNLILVSDINRFVFCFGANPLGSTARDPMLIRWSDQENAENWTPDATNQAGSLRLSRGTEIVAASQARQEVLVWTDSSLSLIHI